MAATPPLQEQTFAWLSGITFIVADETIANIGFDFLESGLLQIIGWQQPDGYSVFTGPGGSNLTGPAYSKWYDGPLSNPGTGGQYYIKYTLKSEIGYVGKGSSVTSGTWIAIDDDPPGTTRTRDLTTGGTITETQSNHYINVIASISAVPGLPGVTGAASVIMDIDIGQMVGGSITLLRTIPNITLSVSTGGSSPARYTFTTPAPTTTTTTAAPAVTTTTTAAPAVTTTTTAAPAVTTTTTAAPAVTTTTTAAPITTTTTAAPAVTTTTTAVPTTTTTAVPTTPAPPVPIVKSFTLINTGQLDLDIVSATFTDPAGIGHVADFRTLGGGNAIVANTVALSYVLRTGSSVTFTVYYENFSAPVGAYTGTIVINSSDAATQTIVNNIIINSRSTTTTTTTTTAAPTSTTTTTSAPSIITTTTTTTTTTAAPTSTTTTTPAPGVTTTTTTTTTAAPTSTTTAAPVDPRANWEPVYGNQEAMYEIIGFRDKVTGQLYNYDGTPFVPFITGNSAG